MPEAKILWLGTALRAAVPSQQGIAPLCMKLDCLLAPADGFGYDQGSGMFPFLREVSECCIQAPVTNTRRA